MLTRIEGIGDIADPMTVPGNQLFYYDFPGESPLYNVWFLLCMLANIPNNRDFV
jgi:hypothetical protein